MRRASSMWPGRIATVAAVAFVAALQVHPLDDADTWWHLASGRWIAAHGTVARTDPFSWSAPGAPWVNRQWLFDLGLWGAWALGGATATIAIAGTLFAAAYGLAWLAARRHVPAWVAAALVALAAQAGVERFVVRPEAASYLLVALYLYVLDGRPRTVALAALVGVQVLWANLHALSALGVVILGCALAGALAERWLPLPAGWRRRGAAATPLAVATLGAILAEVATPFGIEGALFPLRLLTVIRGGEVTSLAVVEHRPTALALLSPPVAAAYTALLALSAVALVLAWRRLDVTRALWALAFVALAVMARRNVGLLGLGVLPLIADGIAPAMAALERRRALAVGAAAVTALVCLVGTAQVVRGTYYDTAQLTRRFGLGTSALLFPPGAAVYLAAHPPARLFNDDVLGGFLTWHDPDRPGLHRWSPAGVSARGVPGLPRGPERRPCTRGAGGAAPGSTRWCCTIPRPGGSRSPRPWRGSRAGGSHTWTRGSSYWSAVSRAPPSSVRATRSRRRRVRFSRRFSSPRRRRCSTTSAAARR